MSSRLNSPMFPLLSPSSPSWPHREDAVAPADIQALNAEARAAREQATAFASARRIGHHMYPNVCRTLERQYVEKEAAPPGPTRGGFEATSMFAGNGGKIETMPPNRFLESAPAAGARTPRSLKDRDLMSLLEQMGAETF